jgi:hypothetical protein
MLAVLQVRWFRLFLQLICASGTVYIFEQKHLVLPFFFEERFESAAVLLQWYGEAR